MTAPGYIQRPNMRHGMRFISEETKRRVQYNMDKRREERGTKVIHVHEKPPARRVWPSTEEMQDRILEYFRVRQELPQVMQVPFHTDAPVMSYAVEGLPFSAEDMLSDGRRLVEMRVEVSDTLGLR